MINSESFYCVGLAGSLVVELILHFSFTIFYFQVPRFGADPHRYRYRLIMEEPTGAQRYPGALPIKELPGSDIKICGYLKKLKTMKKKFFVLRSTSSSGAARLEYYDNEKKFKNGQLPKRSIYLHTCFNINKKIDVKNKHAIALYTKDDCFSVILESESQLENWLKLLLEYQNQYLVDGQKPRIHFEYVWQGTIKPKARANSLDITGQYRLCLCEKSVSLVRVHSEFAEFTFQFSSIRRCGHSENYFFMEVGRSSVTGSGELWMQVEDTGTAQSMHEAVLNAMQTNKSRGFEPGSFRRRSNTSSSSVSHRNTVLGDEAFSRKRTASESHHQGSPRRQHRTTQRPMSSVVYQRPPSLTPDSPTPLASSPHGFVMEHFDEQRMRSDSMGSRSSHTSCHSSVDPQSYDAPITPENSFISHRSMTPEPKYTIPEEDSDYLPMTPHRSITPSPTREYGEKSGGESDYLPMTPTHRSTTPSPTRDRVERPGSSGSESQESGHLMQGVDGYVDMKPGSSGNLNNTGYIDMTPGSAGHGDTCYMKMGSSRITAPIPIRPTEPGYIDMGPSSQPLPTVREGGSGEAYLPMTPTGQSPMSSADLKPAKVVSYLSDDSMSGEFPKRAYSVGSRPAPKPTHRHYQYPNYEQRRQNVLDNSRSSSAPHLIVQKTRNMCGVERVAYQESVSPSPLSQSVKSDDSDSFMEMDFYRPRTASDSYGCRPRSSSFGKQYTQGHRPRSSSYGQQSKNKLSSLVAGSFESVRTTSQELSKRRSQESLGRFSSSSRASSNDSLKRMSEELQQKTNSLHSEYIDMGFENRKTPSPGVHGVVSPSRSDTKENGGYVDMTLGSSIPKSQRGVSPSSSSHSLGSSPASLGHSRSEKVHQDVKIVKPSGQVLHKPGFKSQLRDNQLLVVASHGKGAEKRSPSSSGRESEDESYVPFQPASTSNGQQVGFHQHSLSLDSGSKTRESKNNHSRSPSGSVTKLDSGQKSKSDDEEKYMGGNEKHRSKQEKVKQSKKDSKHNHRDKDPKEKSKHKIDGKKSSGKVHQNPKDLGDKMEESQKDAKDSSENLSQKSTTEANEPKSPNPLQEKVVKGRSPTLEKKLDYNINSDLFGNIIKHEAVGKKQVKVPEKKPVGEECAYLEYLPEKENVSMATASKPPVESNYEEFDPSQSPLTDLNPLTSTVTSVRGQGQDQLQGHDDGPFSYMDFDPVTSPSRTFSQTDVVKKPVPVVSFIFDSGKGQSSQIVSSSAIVTDSPRATRTDDDRSLENDNKNNFDGKSLGGIENFGCSYEENLEKEPVEKDKHSRKSFSMSSSDIHARLERESSDFENSDRSQGQLKDVNSVSGNSVNLSGKTDPLAGQQNVETTSSDITIKGIKPLKRVIADEVEDAGYVDLDFSKNEPEVDVDLEKGHHRTGSSSSLRSIDPLPEEICPIPETPKSYICDDSEDCTFSSDKDQGEVSPSGGKDSGSPWKQSSPRFKSQGPELRSSPNGDTGNLRRSLPCQPSQHGNGNTQLSRQISVPATSVQSPRVTTPAMSSGNRMRKASGPPALQSMVGRTGNENGSKSNQSLDIGQKQNSMPCMNVSAMEQEKSSEASTSLDNSTYHSRHSFSDLSGTYEEMVYPATGLGSISSKSSSQQHLGEQPTQENTLNYIEVELGGSSETVDEKSRTKSRHASSVEEAAEATGSVQYAQIDYIKTESMKNTQKENRDVKFIV